MFFDGIVHRSLMYALQEVVTLVDEVVEGLGFLNNRMGVTICNVVKISAQGIDCVDSSPLLVGQCRETGKERG